MNNNEQQDNELLFHTVFFESPHPMWFFDIQTLRFLEVNQAAIDHYGYSREAFLKMTIRDIRPAEDLPLLEKSLNVILVNKASKRRFRHLLKDGTINHVLLISHPVRYKGCDARLVNVHDITETTIHIERFELIAKATHDAVWDWDLVTGRLWWNDTFHRLFGYAEHTIEPTLEAWTSRFHPDDHQPVINTINQTIKNKVENWAGEYRFLRADGSYAHIYDRAHLIFRDGKAVRMLGSMMDVSAQHQLRLEREQTEALLEKITSAAPTALWMSDADGNLVFVNQTWLDWSGSPFHQNLVESWFDIIHPDDVEKARTTFKQAHEQQQGYELDYRICTSGGKIRWLNATAHSRHDTSAQFLGLVGSCTDQTRQKQLESQRAGFINTVSHELKTPITSLKGYEQLLSRSSSMVNASARPFLERMRLQIDRLDNLVQDLLDISRIETGKLSLRPTIFDMHTAMSETIGDLQLAYPTHKIILTDNQECKVFADKNRVIQLLINLVDNAVKYSPNANRVLIGLSCEEEFLTVFVKDSGVGIVPEQQPFIFERFFQVNNTYKAPGLGLGLFISKEIVSQLNGTIWFETQPAEGSTFYFRLPRLQLV